MNNENKLRLADADVRTAGKVQLVNNEQIAKQNIRTLMQAFQGCRKNCAECKEDEEEWEPKIIQSEVPHA